MATCRWLRLTGIQSDSVKVGTGFVAEWRFTEHWYLWFRFRQFFTVNPAARSLAKRRDTIVHHTDYSIYGLGLGVRF